VLGEFTFIEGAGAGGGRTPLEFTSAIILFMRSPSSEGLESRSLINVPDELMFLLIKRKMNLLRNPLTA
jgi:hypothetical protein